jgi:hypothetical protein
MDNKILSSAALRVEHVKEMFFLASSKAILDDCKKEVALILLRYSKEGLLELDDSVTRLVVERTKPIDEEYENSLLPVFAAYARVMYENGHLDLGPLLRSKDWQSGKELGFQVCCKIKDELQNLLTR